MKRRQWTGWLVICAVLVLCAGTVFAADVKVKYSGPSGQGDIIYWYPATALTNLALTPDGVEAARFHRWTRFDGDVNIHSNLTISGAVVFAVLDVDGEGEFGSLNVVGGGTSLTFVVTESGEIGILAVTTNLDVAGELEAEFGNIVAALTSLTFAATESAALGSATVGTNLDVAAETETETLNVVAAATTTSLRVTVNADILGNVDVGTNLVTGGSIMATGSVSATVNINAVGDIYAGTNISAVGDITATGAVIGATADIDGEMEAGVGNVAGGLTSLTFAATESAALGSATVGTNLDVAAETETETLNVVAGGTSLTFAVTESAVLGSATVGTNLDVAAETETETLNVVAAGTSLTFAVTESAALGSATVGTNLDVAAETETETLNVVAAGTSLTFAVTESATIGDLTVSTNLDVALEIEGQSVNATDSITSGARVAVGTFLNLAAATPITMLEGMTITNAGSYQQLTSSADLTGDVTIAILDGGVIGDFVIYQNTGANLIMIKDGANTKLGGDITLGGNEDDTLSVIWDGSDWVGQANQDN